MTNVKLKIDAKNKIKKERRFLDYLLANLIQSFTKYLRLTRFQVK